MLLGVGYEIKIAVPRVLPTACQATLVVGCRACFKPMTPGPRSDPSCSLFDSACILIDHDLFTSLLNHTIPGSETLTANNSRWNKLSWSGVGSISSISGIPQNAVGSQPSLLVSLWTTVEQTYAINMVEPGSIATVNVQ